MKGLGDNYRHNKAGLSTYKCPKCKENHKRRRLAVDIKTDEYVCLECGFRMSWYVFWEVYGVFKEKHSMNQGIRSRGIRRDAYAC